MAIHFSVAHLYKTKNLENQLGSNINKDQTFFLKQGLKLI